MYGSGHRVQLYHSHKEAQIILVWRQLPLALLQVTIANIGLQDEYRDHVPGSRRFLITLLISHR